VAKLGVLLLGAWVTLAMTRTMCAISASDGHVVMLSVASDNSRDVDELKKAALEAMALGYRNLPTRS
jgi:hypothetical protein